MFCDNERKIIVFVFPVYELLLMSENQLRDSLCLNNDVNHGLYCY